MEEHYDDTVSHGYWPSATDLFLTLFIIAIAILAATFVALLPTNSARDERAVMQAVGSNMQHVREPTNNLREVLRLEKIPASASPRTIVVRLSETSKAAIDEINTLREKMGTLATQLAALVDEDNGKDAIKRVLNEMITARRRVAQLEKLHKRVLSQLGDNPDETLSNILRDNATLRRQLHDKPPIIRIDEQKKAYRFRSGSSVVRPPFAEGLRGNEFPKLAKEILERQDEGRVKVDTLEIIGHTDGVPLNRKGNLDAHLPALLAGKFKGFEELVAGSNNDLGLLRALAVKHQWELFVDSHPEAEILKKLTIRCYSAGQTIPPNNKAKVAENTFRREDPSARRIEMRLTRLNSDK